MAALCCECQTSCVSAALTLAAPPSIYSLPSLVRTCQQSPVSIITQ